MISFGAKPISVILESSLSYICDLRFLIVNRVVGLHDSPPLCFSLLRRHYGCRAQGRALRPCCLPTSSTTAPRHGHTRPASACIHAPRRGQHFDPYHSSRPLQNFFERLKTCRSGTHPHRSQKGYIELGINPAVTVAADRWDATAPLQRPDVLGRTPEKASRFADVNYARHHRR